MGILNRLRRQSWRPNRIKQAKFTTLPPLSGETLKQDSAEIEEYPSLGGSLPPAAYPIRREKLQVLQKKWRNGGAERSRSREAKRELSPRHAETTGDSEATTGTQCRKCKSGYAALWRHICPPPSPTPWPHFPTCSGLNGKPPTPYNPRPLGKTFSPPHPPPRTAHPAVHRHPSGQNLVTGAAQPQQAPNSHVRWPAPAILTPGRGMHFAITPPTQRLPGSSRPDAYGSRLRAAEDRTGADTHLCTGRSF